MPIKNLQRALLMALQPPTIGSAYRPAKHVYAGTVPDAEVARRRAANRRARVSRRINRKH